MIIYKNNKFGTEYLHIPFVVNIFPYYSPSLLRARYPLHAFVWLQLLCWVQQYITHKLNNK